MHRAIVSATLALTLGGALAPQGAGAQLPVQDQAPLRPPQVYLGLGLEVGQAVGEFEDYVRYGVGIGGHFVWRPKPAGPLALRVSGMFLVYGSQTRRYPLVPGINVDVTTTNNIGGMTFGPEFLFGSGTLQAYGHAGIGFSYFATTSSVEGSNQQNQPFASSTNYDDITFAPEGGGGLLIRLSAGRIPIFVDLGARFLNNGKVTYVTKDRITVQGNQLIVNPVESEANLVVYRIGMRIGLRASRRATDSEGPR